MRLLQKTSRSYIIYSVVILLVAIPVFYLVIKQIVREDADEHLQTTKTALQPTIIRAISDNTIGQLSFANQDIVLTPSRNPNEFETFANQDIYDSLSGETVPYRILMINIVVKGQPWLLQIRNSMLDSEDLIESIVKVQVILLLILLSGLLLINRRLSSRIWRPFYTTLDKLNRYKVEQQPSLGLEKSSVNEFDDLNRSLEELTDRAHSTYLAQKEFTENAAHEMQTPLAALQSKLELLMQTSPLNEEQAELIGEMANVGQRMGRLHKSLILLTRIENSQFAGTEPISMRAVVERNMSQFQPQAAEKTIRFELDFSGDPVLNANRSLVEMLVSNLFSNAIRHNLHGGLMLVNLYDKKLVIQNTGKPVTLDPQHIYRRFYKDSADADSIGLGLQIVRQIANLYGWTIDYSYKNGLHGFAVQF